MFVHVMLRSYWLPDRIFTQPQPCMMGVILHPVWLGRDCKQPHMLLIMIWQPLTHSIGYLNPLFRCFELVGAAHDLILKGRFHA